MLSVNDFTSRFENYNDDQLFEIYSTLDSYSDEAKEAFNIVVARKGGIEVLKDKNLRKRAFENEIGKIKKEALRLSVQGNNIDFLKKIITSEIVPPGIVNDTIEKAFDEAGAEREDKKIKPKTVVGAILGGFIASVVGGILWGLQMIYSNRIFYILFIGLILLCYGIIKMLTKQSYKNTVVIVATVISVLLSLLFGSVLFDIVGLRK